MLSILKHKVNFCQKNSNKERQQYSNCILDMREKKDAELGITNFVSANKFLDLCVSSLNYKHTAFLGGLWSPSKPSCWEKRMSFCLWRSQSRYPISRGWKSRIIWYSSKWKHLHCHLFSFLSLSCWNWITQRSPNMSLMAVDSYKTRVLQKLGTCLLLCKLSTFSIVPPWMSLSALHMQPHADTDHWQEKHLWIIFPGLCITILGFLSGQSEPSCMSLVQNGRLKRCLSRSKQTNSSITKKRQKTLLFNCL